jgi:HK97 family phage prohead protease
VTDVERRFTPGQVEVRAAKDSRAVGGYALKFNTQSRNLGGFVEQINTSALNKSRGDGWPEVMARYNHDDNMLLGTTAARTLRLTLDEVGLVYEVDVPQARADVYELVQRGDVNKSSFAFVVPPDGDEWGLNDLDIPLRTLNSIKLIDVAPVNAPAYLDTTTAVRSLAEKMHADPAEVRKLAAQNELKRFFKKTADGSTAPAHTTFGPSARMAILGRAQDPWA